jgi:hypothetical protein
MAAGKAGGGPTRIEEQGEKATKQLGSWYPLMQVRQFGCTIL